MNKKNIIKRLSFIVMFSALTTVLYIFAKFPLPIFPSFLDINLSMIPVIICAFMLGPWDALVCLLVRFAIKMPMSGTMYVGEIADLILGMVPAITAGCIYRYSNNKHKAGIALGMVIVSWTITGLLVNAFFNIPAYAKMIGMDTIINMSAPAFKIISFGNIDVVNEENFMLYYLTIGVLPFNILLSSVIVGITAPVHRRLRHLYDMIGTRGASFNADEEEVKKEEILTH